MRAYACGTPIRGPLIGAAAESVGVPLILEGKPVYQGGDAIIWGCIRGAPELMKEVRKRGHDFWQMDNAYRGRNSYFRITKNAFQHVGLEQSSPNRWEVVAKRFGLEIKPWTKGKHIVIALSTEHLYRLHGLELKPWLEQTVKTIKKHSDREIVVREKNATGPIEDFIKNAHALVTYTSMAALDALQMGVPVFCDEKCAVAPMAQQDLSRIESPVYPDDRERLFWTLADHQFTKEELKEGLWKKYSSVMTNMKQSLITS